jgi:hypothetical protein
MMSIKSIYQGGSDRPTMASQRQPNYIMKKEKDMPLHKGKSKKVMEENFHELKEAHPEMENKQRTAIVLNQARKSGAHLPKKHSSHSSHHRHKEHR